MKKFLLLLFLCPFLIVPSASYAAHNVGMEIKYEHLTGNDYRIRFTFFRDCTGIPVAPTYTVHGKSNCGNNINIIVALDSSAEISQLCEGDSSKCLSPISPYMDMKPITIIAMLHFLLVVCGHSE